MRRSSRAVSSWEIITVAKPEWGAKRTCLGCGAKFYDMGRNPITCPACDEPFAVAAPSRSRRTRKEEPKAAEPAAAAAPVAVDDGAAADEDEVDALAAEVEDLLDDDEDDEDDAIATLTDDEEEDDDDVLAEADIAKKEISDE
ncbi:MAG: TIGR02300 family protein [Alphaproteobacteria bacterium]|nr:TIGR02300 family protein [Alphaproteobacteria bacterium]MDP6875673.1 TIGR02300 family protein [Alphaproteobacteria bacterium]